MPHLFIKYSDRPTERYVLDLPRITIGRSAKNDLCIPDPFLSRVHTEISREGDRYLVRDLESANGTFYNGIPLEQPAMLESSGRIQIGETEIIYFDELRDTDALAKIVAEISERPKHEALALTDQTTCGPLDQTDAAPPSTLQLLVDNERQITADVPSATDPAMMWPLRAHLTRQHGTDQARAGVKREVFIPLRTSFRFAHEPFTARAENFVGRTAELKLLSERILFSEGGSFLVTGYRGVGKTSFINQVVHALENYLGWAKDLRGPVEFVDIHLNVARPLGPSELMHHVIRGLFQRLNEKKLFDLLDPETREELSIAYRRTSLNMTRRLTEISEKGVGLNEASLGADYLKATLKTSLFYKRSSGDNFEASFLGYDDKAAEQDIIRISHRIAAGYTARRSALQKIGSLFRKQPLPKTSLKIIFVFDELDKLEGFTRIDGGKAEPVIDDILESLKNLFTTSGISFIFIAGKDLQERWLEDLGKGDSVYESIFSHELYLSCMWGEVDEICDRFIDWPYLTRLADFTPEQDFACKACGSAISSGHHSCKQCGFLVASAFTLPYLESVYREFKRCLAYKGRGIPRRIIREFNQYVQWQFGRPLLTFSRQDIRRIRFYGALQTVLEDSERWLIGNVHEEISGTYLDKRRLGIYYLVDWIMRQGKNRFTIKDAGNATKLLSARITLTDEVASSVVRNVVNVLLKNEFVQKINRGFDQAIVGDAANREITEYELPPRRLAEMGGIASVFEEESHIFALEEDADKRIAHFTLVREIGKGGMGTIYEAKDERSGHTVVLKMMATHNGLANEMKERLKREARILSSLHHPNIIKYYEVGEEGGRFYIVMDYVEGIDLRVLLKSQGRLDLSVAFAIARPAAEALRYVHNLGYVRVDIKPGNILISKSGHVYLIDFGTAKDKTTDGGSITYAGEFIGTPGYMSPEQFTGMPADVRSDIYSFGLVLYEMLTGKKAFEVDSLESRRSRVNQLPDSPSKYVSLPPKTEAIILKCLELDPEKRFQHTSDLIKELDEEIGYRQLTNLGPIAETITDQVELFETIDRMETSASCLSAPVDDYPSHEDVLLPENLAHSDTPLLRIIDGPVEFTRTGYSLNKDIIAIGRSPSNDLVLDSTKVSRYNSEILCEQGTYYINDLNSANITRVNGGLITDKTKLSNKDKIQIGDFVLEFRQGESSRSARQSDLLALISKVGVSLLAAVTLNETLEQIVALVFEAVPADRCMIMMRNEKDPGLKVAVARLRDPSGEVGEIRISRSVIDEVVVNGKSVLTSDAQADPRFAGGTVMLQGVRSVLAVPLGVGANVFGIIYADSPLADGRFTEDHLKVLTTLASVAAIRVENARLTEEQIERERLEREQQVASEIQQRFLPATAPIVAGYELQGISFPCYEIGGDYYDFIQREDGKLVVVLGDVSGKGTAAALLMSSLRAAVHTQADMRDSLVKKIRAINRYLIENIPRNRFVMLFYGELDPKNGTLAFLNAGHDPPLIVHAGGTMEWLASGGLPLGIKPDADFQEGRARLNPADVLVIYSDGVSEAVNPSGEEFGPTRLHEVVARNLDASAGGIRDRIESALTKFCQGTPSTDDITFVIVKRNADMK